VIKPTAAVGMAACRRTASASGTRKLAPAGTRALGVPAPELQSIKSTPSAFSFLASSIDSSRVQPPSNQSVHDSRTASGLLSGHFGRTSRTVSSVNRMRFSKLPPYSSRRALDSGEWKLCIR